MLTHIDTSQRLRGLSVPSAASHGEILFAPARPLGARWEDVAPRPLFPSPPLILFLAPAAWCPSPLHNNLDTRNGSMLCL